MNLSRLLRSLLRTTGIEVGLKGIKLYSQPGRRPS